MSTPDPWDDLRAYTAARLALGRAGSSMPTTELLRFGFAHAQARDAVHIQLDTQALADVLAADGLPSLQVHSAAGDRASYLLRPDLGRRLDDASAERLRDAAGPSPTAGCDLLLVFGDGLSSLAVERNAHAMVTAIRAGLPAGWTLGHKTGTCGTAYNDVAFFRTPAGNEYVLAVYLDRPAVHGGQAEAAIANVARLAARVVR